MALRRSPSLRFTIGDTAAGAGGPPVVSDIYSLGNTGMGTVGTMIVQLASTSFVGSLTVVARKWNPHGQTGTTPPWTAIPYTSRYLNGVVGADTTVTTAITSDSKISIDASGLEIGLQVGAYTSGTMQVDYEPLAG